MTASSPATEQAAAAGDDRPTARILPFLQPVRAGQERPADAGNRLSLRDRLLLSQWEAIAFAHGFLRVTINTSAPDGCAELGDFISLYRDHSGWARWCVGCVRGGFTLWRMDGHEAVGWYPVLSLALDAVLSAGTPAAEAAAGRHGMTGEA